MIDTFAPRLLVVDDDPSMRTLILRVLKENRRWPFTSLDEIAGQRRKAAWLWR